MSQFRRLQAMQISQQVQEQQNRADFIQFLYARSGRTCGTYSGLWQEFKQEVLDELAQQLAVKARNAWAEHHRNSST